MSRPKPAPEKKSNPYGLSDRQWLFAQEYAACGVGAKAAVKACYSRKCAKQAAGHSGPDGDRVPITIIQFHGVESREA